MTAGSLAAIDIRDFFLATDPLHLLSTSDLINPSFLYPSCRWIQTVAITVTVTEHRYVGARSGALSADTPPQRSGARIKALTISLRAAHRDSSTSPLAASNTSAPLHTTALATRTTLWLLSASTRNLRTSAGTFVPLAAAVCSHDCPQCGVLKPPFRPMGLRQHRL